jgi:hypothetical protein
MGMDKNSSTMSIASIDSPALSRKSAGYKSRQRDSESVRSARNSEVKHPQKNMDNSEAKSSSGLSITSDMILKSEESGELKIKSKSNRNVSEWKDSPRPKQELQPVDQSDARLLNHHRSTTQWNVEPGIKFVYSRSRAELQPKPESQESDPIQHKSVSSANPLLNPHFDINEIKKNIKLRSSQNLMVASQDLENHKESSSNFSQEIILDTSSSLSKQNSNAPASASSETGSKYSKEQNAIHEKKSKVVGNDVEKGMHTIVLPNDCDSYFITAKTLTNLRFLFAIVTASYLSYLVWKKRFELSYQLYAYNLLLTSLYFILNFYKSMISNYQISTELRIDRNFNLVFQIISSFSILLVVIYWMFVIDFHHLDNFSEDKQLDLVSYHIGFIVIVFEVLFSRIDISKNKSAVVPILVTVYEAVIIALNYYLNWRFPFKFFDYYLNLSINPFLLVTNLVISIIISIVALMLVYYTIVVRNLVVERNSNPNKTQ